MNRTVYVRQSDETWWERGAELAARRGKALPALISDLLRREIIAESIGESVEKTPSELLDEATDLIGQAQAKLEPEP